MAACAMMMILLAACPSPDGPSNDDTGPTDTAHLDMLKSLGINVNGTKRLDPQGNELPATYDPLGSRGTQAGTGRSGRAATASGGKAVLFPLRELFISGLKNGSYYTGLYENLDKQSSFILTPMWNPAGAEVWDHSKETGWGDWMSFSYYSVLPKKAVAGDFDGDGIDEVLVVLVNRTVDQNKAPADWPGDDKISFFVADYNGSTTSPFKKEEEFVYNGPTALNTAFSDIHTEAWGDQTFVRPSSEFGRNENAVSRFDMAVGDIDGDGKDEVILAIADIVYLLDNNFSTIKEISVPVVSDEFNYLQVATADYDQDGIDEWILVKGSSKQNRVATWHIYKNTV